MEKCQAVRFSSIVCRATGEYVAGKGDQARAEMRQGNYMCLEHVKAHAKSLGAATYTEIKQREKHENTQRGCAR